MPWMTLSDEEQIGNYIDRQYLPEDVPCLMDPSHIGQSNITRLLKFWRDRQNNSKVKVTFQFRAWQTGNRKNIMAAVNDKAPKRPMSKKQRGKQPAKSTLREIEEEEAEESGVGSGEDDEVEEGDDEEDEDNESGEDSESSDESSEESSDEGERSRANGGPTTVKAKDATAEEAPGHSSARPLTTDGSKRSTITKTGTIHQVPVMPIAKSLSQHLKDKPVVNSVGRDGGRIHGVGKNSGSTGEPSQITESHASHPSSAITQSSPLNVTPTVVAHLAYLQSFSADVNYLKLVDWHSESMVGTHY